MFRKQTHPLMVEEETYNWSSPKSGVNRQLLYLSILFVAAGMLFSVLR